MAHEERLVERVRSVLADRPDVIEKRMVGGRSFIVAGHLCCGVSGGDLMVRVGPTAYAWALAQPHVRPMQFGSRPLMGYVLVAPEAHEDNGAMTTWVAQGVEFVSTLPPTRPTGDR